MAGTTENSGQQWDDVAGAYQRMTVQTSRAPIGKMLERADALWPLKAAVGILDNGCGPGPIMARILEEYVDVPASCKLACTDFSDGMVEWVMKRKREAVETDPDSAWQRVECFNQNAMDLDKIQDASQSHVTAGWVFFMTPEPQKCLSEARRVLREGGVLTCSGWQHSQWEELLRLLSRVRPDKALPAMRQGWESAAAMKGELETAGFRDVEAFEVPTRMDYEEAQPFMEFMVRKLPFMKPVVKDMTEDEVERLIALMVQETPKFCPVEPGWLEGTALVAVGRK